MRSVDVSNTNDIIDSRDIIARIDELEDLETTVNDAKEELDTAKTALADKEEELGFHDTLVPEEDLPELIEVRKTVDECEKALTNAEVDFGEDEQHELKSLRSLQKEAEGYCEWYDGATLVRDNHWVDYCESLLDALGELPKDLPSYIVIDWQKTADNLQADYTSVDFDGVEYWVR